MIGQTIFHYQIIEELGEGGMGVVWKAHDTLLNRLVALKMLPPAKIADADRRARFVQEAQADSVLNHPGIITIYDIVQHDGADVIVMEFVAGIGTGTGRQIVGFQSLQSTAACSCCLVDSRSSLSPPHPISASAKASFIHR